MDSQLVISLGADPEVFVKDHIGSNIPAFTFLEDKYTNRQYYWDGHQAEFTIPPAQDSLEAIGYIREGLQSILNEARKVNPQAQLDYRCLIETPIEELRKLPYRFINFGCNPSLNIYNTKSIRLNPRKVPIRVAGCHIHIGLQDFNAQEHKQYVYKKIRCLDNTVLPLATAMLQGLESPQRRELYGKPGEHRVKSYGIEYRTLASTVLIDPRVTKAMFDIVHKFPDDLLEYESTDELTEIISYCVDDPDWVWESTMYGVKELTTLSMEKNWGLV